MKLTITPETRLFFCSDSHYGHSNICRGTSTWVDADEATRNFSTLEKMNTQIVNNINSSIKEDDILFHLGDWSFGGRDRILEFRKRLICKNIFIVPGNHDHHIKSNKVLEGENGENVNAKDLFTEVLPEIVHLDLRINYSRVKVEKYNFILSHFPIASWTDMNKGFFHLHGHLHLPSDKKITGGKAMDIGLDGNNLYPYPLSKVLSIMKKQEIRTLKVPEDHHRKRL